MLELAIGVLIDAQKDPAGVLKDVREASEKLIAISTFQPCPEAYLDGVQKTIDGIDRRRQALVNRSAMFFALSSDSAEYFSSTIVLTS